MSKSRAVVVVPIYKSTLDEWEQVSLRRCVEVLNAHPIVFVAPESLSTEVLQEEFGIGRVERFSDSYFAGIDGYNRLMLCPEFYERFLDYEYLLICQTDAYVFSDRLDEWCARGWDYIGAPWIPSAKYNAPWRRAELFITQSLGRLLGRYNSRSNYFRTGNGGFSLRRVVACLDVVRADAQPIGAFLARGNYHYAEDIYWSICANRIRRRLSIPHYTEALGFAFENHPAQLYTRNGGQLPFGAHAWYKGSRLDFWRRFISLPESLN